MIINVIIYMCVCVGGCVCIVRIDMDQHAYDTRTVAQTPKTGLQWTPGHHLPEGFHFHECSW